MKKEKSDALYLIPEPTKDKIRKRNNTLLILTLVLGLFWISMACLGLYRLYFQETCTEECSEVPDFEKFDCHPEADATESSCELRGCCFGIPDNLPQLGIPYCYYPADYAGYTIRNITHDSRDISALLQRETPSGFPDDIQTLKLKITFVADDILRIKITDANVDRFEVPIPINDDLRKFEEPLYHLTIDPGTGQLFLTRKSTGVVIFSTYLSRLVYSNQFLQISTRLPSPYVYGIGEHYGSLLQDINWSRITLFNSDRAPVPGKPLYGSHPFYLSLESGGKANGVFLLNSNAMDVILQPTPAITFRPIGGILDLFIMLGPSPAAVVQQYTSIVGRTFMPPYWSLGFHLCRYGYNSLNKTRETMQRNIDAGIPIDVQWNDIDYMDRYKDFTYDETAFDGLPEFVDDLHKKGMHYVIMTDPGLSNSEKPGTYAPYDEGVVDDVFIKNPNGTIFVGKVWTDGTNVFPDFSHPNATAFWTKQFADFYKKVNYDGVWIDMNEPSNFYNGGIDGCMKSSYEDPVYLPNGQEPLRTKTVCMTAKHHKTIHYNEHNLLAYREATATNYALRTTRNRRPFIISRATFAGQGAQSGHWSGDIYSTWEDMRYTIPSLLNFNLYGISMIGSDICGFNDNTTVELCARWQALGAFYPFSRNHNERVTIEQDPWALGPIVVEATKKALELRYSLLPYMYTLFARSHIYGDTVIRPLFFEFPLDSNTYSIDEQFLWGPAFMVIPTLYPGATNVTAYLPEGIWYHSSGIQVSSKQYVTLPSDLTVINYVVRGGYIIPIQAYEMTTTASRKNPFNLLAALDEKQEARGELYWDDGDSLNTFEKKSYNWIQFTVSKNTLKSEIISKGYLEEPMKLLSIGVMGVGKMPVNVTMNGLQCTRKSPGKIPLDVFSLHKIDEICPEKLQNNTCVFFSYPNFLSIYNNNPGSISLLSPLVVTWT